MNEGIPMELHAIRHGERRRVARHDAARPRSRVGAARAAYGAATVAAVAVSAVALTATAAAAHAAAAPGAVTPAAASAPPAAATPPAGAEARTPHARARLLAAADALVPGRPATLLVALDLAPGWHTYWRNPGDSGAATSLDWRLPPGYAASAIAWPHPERLPLPPLANYGYKARALHLVELGVPADARPGTHAELATRARWLVCSDVCIPEEADLALRLPVRAQSAPVEAHAPLFAAALAALPRPAPGAVLAQAAGSEARLEFDAAWNPVLDGARDVLFFPYADGALDHAAPQPLAKHDGRWQLSARLGYLASAQGLPAVAVDGRLGGVLVATRDGARVAYELQAAVANP
ncbi:MAG: protein-disulfide reductase DsbD family protein [Steroidobacteraceae bacterium]|nr:protein-disulfide reductase DsbD family protein [Steroidobacteraceae bacterium]